MTTCRRPIAGSTASSRATRILADLEALGLIDRIEPHKLTVPRGDRSNAVLEPLLTDQWFVDIKPLAAPAIRAVEEGRIRFVPENWSGVYLRMDAQHQGLVHQPTAVVGSPHTGVVRQRRPLVRCAQRSARRAPRTGSIPRWPCARTRTCWTPGFPRRSGPSPRRAGRSRRTRPAHVLPDVRSGHGLRHHLLLGRPHDHDGPEVHRPGSVSRSLRARPDPRSRRPEDVQVQGQRDRPARHRRRDLARGADRQAHQRPDAAADEAGHRKGDPQAVSAGHSRLRHRRAAAHLRVARDAEPRSALRHGARSRATAISATSCGMPRATC